MSVKSLIKIEVPAIIVFGKVVENWLAWKYLFYGFSIIMFDRIKIDMDKLKLIRYNSLVYCSYCLWQIYIKVSPMARIIFLFHTCSFFNKTL